ncbi:MAG TPA: class I SAM-dependent methyltransferase [Anaerolineales bacterium]|nr:class I SAM-dependent methyltransferase [Anaerolineales bacterium]
MKLSTVEFRAMQSSWRKWGQAYFELPLFQRMGLNVHNKDVLEIGCGNGHGGYLLNQLHPRSYIGLDVMEEQIELARRKYPQHKFIVQDATDLSQFADASKDIVIIFGVLHHIPEWRKTLDDIARVLKPDGQLFLEEPRGVDLKFFDFIFRWGHPNTDFGLNALEEYLKALGFKYQKQWTPLLTMYHGLRG